MTEQPSAVSAGVPDTAAAPDEVLRALDELLAVARENIVSWVGVMERADEIREQRRSGMAFSQMQVVSAAPPVIDSVARNQERLTTAAAHYRRALARALASEGLSYAEIARLFGVTRQRVGNLLRGDDVPPA